MNKYWHDIRSKYAELKKLYLLENSRESDSTGDPLWAAFMAYYEIRKQVECDRHRDHEMAR